MPNQLTSTGLQVLTKQELVTKLSDGFKAIYGNDINIDSDTPDGQMINLFAQAVVDNLDLLVQVYNSFDPDKAFGSTLDQRVSLNGIQRQGGTFSRTNITIVTTQAVTLFGKDQLTQPVYTVSDDSQNEWELIETEAISGAGTYVLEFQAKVAGEVLTTPNTITNPVTIILGVSSINNPTVQSVIGTNEESDFDLKIRRQQSVSLASQGYLTSILSALRNITGVTDAFVYENNTSSTDSDGVPPHSIWAIVAGNYNDEDVARAIYQKRNAGCGMFGDQSFPITQLDDTIFIVNWDEVETIDVFVKFTATSIDGIFNPDYDLIKTQLPTLFIPEVFQKVNINTLSSFIQQIDSNCLITNAGFSELLAGPYESILTPPSKKNQFILSSNNIIILPILISPETQSIAQNFEIPFIAKGGYGSYTWTLHVNNSGGTINASTGLYESGSSSGVDTIRVTDSDGNFSDVLITVV